MRPAEIAVTISVVLIIGGIAWRTTQIVQWIRIGRRS